MPRPNIDLEPHKHVILGYLDNGITQKQMVEELRIHFQLHVSQRTLRSRLQDWGYESRRPHYDFGMLYNEIYPLFTAERMTDDEIVLDLKTRNIEVGARTVRRLRASYHLLRRLDSHDKDADHIALVQRLEAEFEDGAIYGLGRTLLAAHCQRIGIIAARDRLFAALKDIDPAGVEARKHGLQRIRGQFIIQGPNKVWSVDGHMKLKRWGFEVYAAVDAYSRKIIWLYVGITACTQVSCYAQYLKTVERTGIIPEVVKSDYGVETPLFAAAHFVLHKDLLDGMDWQECYAYTTGRKNQRIESLWNQLGRAVTFKWRVGLTNLFAVQFC
jgi:hypothetical protein